MQLALALIGIIYALRRPKLEAITIEQFPTLPADRFAEWKTLELKSIDLFLWATWGLLPISILADKLVAACSGGVVVRLVAQIPLVLAFLVLLTLSAIRGTKAARLKRELGIKWPKK